MYTCVKMDGLARLTRQSCFPLSWNGSANDKHRPVFIAVLIRDVSVTLEGWAPELTTFGEAVGAR